MPTERIERDFWNNRRVFVTGHTGFIGGWVCAWLAGLNARVGGFSLPPSTEPNFFHEFGLADMMDSRFGDIRDSAALEIAITEFEPEIVLHLAAQPLVRHAHADPLDTFSTNVMGTAHLMQALRKTPSARAAVIMTTDKVYENQEQISGYREDDRLGGFEPYGCSKACAEHVVDAYRHSYFAGADAPVGIATIRAGNVIGGGDWSADRLIPDAIRAFIDGTALHIRNPRAVRPWQHVLDPVHGILMLAERLVEDPTGWQGGWNMGPPEHEFHTVEKVADEMVRIWGDGAKWINGAAEGDAPYEAKLLTLNPSKAMARLGWRQNWPFQRALATTVEWYKAHQSGDDLRALSMHQIAAFEGAN